MKECGAQTQPGRPLIRMRAKPRLLLMYMSTAALIVLSILALISTVIVQVVPLQPTSEQQQTLTEWALARKQREICVDSNVIAIQGLGDIVLRLRPAIVMGEILGARLTSPKVETYHGYSTTEMLGLQPCDPAPIRRQCILTTVLDGHAFDTAVERYCQRDTADHKRQWESFVENLRKFENCSSMHLSYKAEYHITKTRCFAGWTQHLLRANHWKRPKRTKSILIHRRGGDVEKGVGVEGDVWSPDDEKYRKALQSIKSHCNDIRVTMVTQTKNVTELRQYYGIDGMDIRNGGDIIGVLKLATEFEVVLVGGGGFAALIVQLAQPRLVLHYAKHGYDYDEWNDARLETAELNITTLAAACA
jgi:hypothetical protein